MDRRPTQTGPVPKIDWVGAALSAAGLSLFVFGLLQASEWGWVRDVNSPIAPFGLALTPFVVGAGVLALAWFVRWSQRRTLRGLDPLFRLALLEVKPLRAGLQMFLAQNLIPMGVFFSIPLYLQVVQGLDALATGLKMLPVSVAMFIMSFVGARMSQGRTPQWIVRLGLWVLFCAVMVLVGTIEPVLAGPAFGISMALLGVGMGLMASQLGNVVQSSIGPRDRSEAGGLQYTAQQLGSSIGTALIGAIVISALATGFVSKIAEDERISPELSTQIGVQLSGSLLFLPTDQVAETVRGADLTVDEQDAIITAYSEAQLQALRMGLLATIVVIIVALFLVRRIPDVPFEELAGAHTEDGADLAS